MRDPVPAARSDRLLHFFDLAGNLLALQFLFLLASLPIVSVLPAAVALQRSLRHQVAEGRPATFGLFLHNLKWALARTWKVSLAVPLLAFGGFVSVLFWYSVGGAGGAAALCVLLPLIGVGLAFYIALLAAAMLAPREEEVWAWFPRAGALLRRRPLPLAGAVVVLITWALLVAQLPTLLPVGSGLVPAAVAWWVVRSQEGWPEPTQA